jgi:hypothetical protein
MAKKQVDLRKLTTFRKREEIKRRRHEEQEKLEVLGQESDQKAVKWVREDLENREKTDREEENQGLEILTTLRKNVLKYNTFLTTLVYAFLKGEDISPKYTIDVVTNKIGIAVGIRGTNFRGAFKTTGMPKYDLFAAKRLAILVGNTTAHLDGYRPKSEGGITLPDEVDTKKYGRKRRI